MSHPVIRAEQLTKTYGDFTAVKGISFEVPRGESFGLLGPNGAGKSTTMKMIASVSTRSSGVLEVLGMDPNTHGPDIRAKLGVVPQEDNLDQELRVRENLLTYGRYFGLSHTEAAKRADALLEFAQLTDRAGSKVEPLSGGMKRRLTIARALVNEPEILMLDEPAGGLGQQDIEWMNSLIRNLTAQMSVLIVEHHMDVVMTVCDRLYVLNFGEVISSGTADIVRRDPAVIAAYLGASKVNS